MNDLYFELLKQAFILGFEQGRLYQSDDSLHLSELDATKHAYEKPLNDFLKQHFGEGKLFPERRSERRE